MATQPEKTPLEEEQERSPSPTTMAHSLTCNTEMPGLDYGLRGAFIGISGLIGAGKSTLAKGGVSHNTFTNETALGEELGLPVYYENVVHNAYLEDFYKDQAKYSFPLQVIKFLPLLITN